MDVIFLSNDDDWVFVYVNDEVFYSNHSIPDFIWVRLLMSDPVKSVRRFLVDFEEHPEAYSIEKFSDIPFDVLEEIEL